MPSVRTPPCICCGNSSIVEINDNEYHSFIVEREFAQDAMPDRSADFRELLITGTHDGCWMTLYYDAPGAQKDFRKFLGAIKNFFLPVGVKA